MARYPQPVKVLFRVFLVTPEPGVLGLSALYIPCVVLLASFWAVQYSTLLECKQVTQHQKLQLYGIILEKCISLYKV